ncbi:MAG TPA: MoaD/ThiS family protein [Candidatus Binatia bacterium]|nr:MoaD/ThiS family protein [Candidatus Binatia bacterium]
MRITFHLPGVLHPFAGGQSTVEIDTPGTTLADALLALWTLYPGIRDRMATEQGQVREHINVFIGDENIRFTGNLMTPIAAGSDITILPAVSGGCDPRNL